MSFSFTLDIKWNREWFPNLHRFPKAHFKVMENRKKFMDDLAVTLNIKKPRDWGNITLKQIHELGGGPLLNNYYRGSLFACLQSVHRGMNQISTYFFFFTLAKRYHLEKRMVLQYS